MIDPCAECGFACDTPMLDGLRAIARLPQDIRDVIAMRPDAPRARPAAQLWSPHEYIWHLADIFRLSAEWMHDIRTLTIRHTMPSTWMHWLRCAATAAWRCRPGQWALEQACGLFIAEAAVTLPTRTCYYHDWQDVTAAQVVSFLAHEAAHHLFDLRRQVESQEVSHVH